MVGETVSGVLEFYSEKAIELDPEMQKVMAQVGIQLGRVVERERAQAEISALAMTDQLTGAGQPQPVQSALRREPDTGPP